MTESLWLVQRGSDNKIANDLSLSSRSTECMTCILNNAGLLAPTAYTGRGGYETDSVWMKSSNISKAIKFLKNRLNKATSAPKTSPAIEVEDDLYLCDRWRLDIEEYIRLCELYIKFLSKCQELGNDIIQL